ncbi:uncharacterized protein LOC144819955 [Lissotriton helveticus]
MTSSGSPIRNGEFIRLLLEALQRPAEIAVVKCTAHTKGTDFVTQGNRYADKVARYCAEQGYSFTEQTIEGPRERTELSMMLEVADTWEELRDMQGQTSDYEKRVWESAGCVKGDLDMWVSADGRAVLPNELVSAMARQIHGPVHLGRDAMVRVFRQTWYNPKFRQAAEAVCQRCVTCQQLNVGKRTPVTLSHIGRSGGPFYRIQIDFIEMPRCNRLRYVLVIVCVFSRWVEAYPTRRCDTLTVAKLLLRELVPRFGVPTSLESDRGKHFNSEVVKMLCSALNIDQRLHCSYRPEASGIVEQINGTLKPRMAKVCSSTSLKWPDALPLVLMSMRSTPDRRTGLSPHEVLMGMAMRLPSIPTTALMNITDDVILDYCRGLSDVMRSVSLQVQAAEIPASSDLCHDLCPGDWVLVRKHVRKSCLDVRWRGPFQVILVTTTAVKCGGFPNWVHASHTRRVPAPKERTAPLVDENNNEEEDSSEGASQAVGVPVELGDSPDQAGNGQDESDTESASEGGSGGEGDLSAEEVDSGDEQGVRTRTRRARSAGDHWPKRRRRMNVRLASEKDLAPVSEESDPEEGEQGAEQGGPRRSRRVRVPSQRYATPEWTYPFTNARSTEVREGEVSSSDQYDPKC